MPTLTVSLTPALAKRLARQAKRHKRSASAELAYIVETWFREGLEETVQFGEEVHRAMDKAFAKALPARPLTTGVRIHVKFKASKARKRR